MISQLLSYGVFWWFIFIIVAFVAACLGRPWGILAGSVAIAALVAALDLHWIRAEMQRPGWDGQPDQDAIFSFGVLIRVILINTFLLPLSILGWLARNYQNRDALSKNS